MRELLAGQQAVLDAKCHFIHRACVEFIRIWQGPTVLTEARCPERGNSCSWPILAVLVLALLLQRPQHDFFPHLRPYELPHSESHDSCWRVVAHSKQCRFDLCAILFVEPHDWRVTPAANLDVKE